MRLKLIIISTILSVLFLASCQDEPLFPDEPQLKFKELIQETEDGQDVARLILSFTDGDGNLGLEQGDTSGFFCDTCFYYYNLFCNYYEKQNGEWVHFSYEDEDILVPFYYRVPRVEPNGQNPTLEGDIEVDMLTYFIPFTGFDTCRFEAFIVDRALNHSNTVVTREFIKP